MQFFYIIINRIYACLSCVIDLILSREVLSCHDKHDTQNRHHYDEFDDSETMFFHTEA